LNARNSDLQVRRVGDTPSASLLAHLLSALHIVSGFCSLKALGHVNLRRTDCAMLLLVAQGSESTTSPLY